MLKEKSRNMICRLDTSCTKSRSIRFEAHRTSDMSGAIIRCGPNHTRPTIHVPRPNQESWAKSLRYVRTITYTEITMQHLARWVQQWAGGWHLWTSNKHHAAIPSKLVQINYEFGKEILPFLFDLVDSWQSRVYTLHISTFNDTTRSWITLTTIFLQLAKVYWAIISRELPWKARCILSHI